MSNNKSSNPASPTDLAVPGIVAPPLPSASEAAKPVRQAFVILIRDRRKKTLHPVLNAKAGVNVLAEFEDSEQALATATSLPACAKNEFFVVPVDAAK